MGRKVVLSSQHCLMKLKKMKSEKALAQHGAHSECWINVGCH